MRLVKQFQFAGCLISVVILSSCATAAKVTMTRTQPSERVTQNERHLDESPDKVWDRLVEGLSKSFFVVNNIAKESRLINLSFSSSEPETYIDCGRTARTYGSGASLQTYEYGVASNAAFRYSRQAGSNSYYDYNLERKTSLEGRINIFVAPDGNGTKVTVNTRYVLTVGTSGTYQLVGGALRIVQGSGVVPESHQSFQFTTNERRFERWGVPPDTATVTCESRGVLETQILNMASGS